MRNRYQALAPQPLFAGLEYSDDRSQLTDWVPLMMAERNGKEPVAATRSLAGTDVNFGALTRLMLDNAVRRGVALHLEHRVLKVRRDRNGRWATTVRDLATGRRRTVRSRFLFVGAGGGALPLLQSAGIPEIKGFGGFPVSGQFLRTRNPQLVAQHQAKVYGQAKVGAPPMSVPHLDLRLIDGEQALLFGPYAGFSPRFLKSGSLWDLPRSVRTGNLGSMLGAGLANIPLTKYLIGQVLQSEKARFRALEEFVPTAEQGDWELITAGQRVQVIKQDTAGRGVLQFGTELVVGAEGSIAGLLGASPGASTATSAMLTLLERCFPDRIDGWRPLLQGAIPSYGHKLSEEPALLAQVFADTTRTLELHS
jgi:malate dehydrogenase (quinone)